MDTKYAADTKIANSRRQFEMQKANFDMEVNAKVRKLLQIRNLHLHLYSQSNRTEIHISCIQAGNEYVMISLGLE